MEESLDTIIVGGGVSGLSLAYYLIRGGAKVRLFEARSELGGNIRTKSHDGFLYDLGPDSFLKTRPFARDLCLDLGLGEQLIEPLEGARQVYAAFEGRLHPMPEGLSLGVPTRPFPLLASDLLSAPGKARALLEPFVPRRTEDAEEESIFGFLARRLGVEMAERIAAPLLAGVFAGSDRRISMDAAFPQMVELERQHGSLYSGMHQGKPFWEIPFLPATKAESPFLSLKGGLKTMIERLEDCIGPSALRLSEEVLSVETTGDQVKVITRRGEAIAPRLILAGPPWQAEGLLSPVDPELGRELREVRGSPTLTVFFGLELGRMERELSGSGFIVPPGEGRILAATYVSSKWAGRAPPGMALLRAFLGGARDAGSQMLSASDEAVIRLAHSELERFCGKLGQPVFTSVCRYERGSPQPELGHTARLARIRARLKRYPRISLIGPGYGGVGIVDCVRSAQELSAQILGKTAA